MASSKSGARFLRSARAAWFGLLDDVRSALYLRDSSRRLRATYPFFSEDWYLAKYPELSFAKEPAISHYFTLGWQEGREPHYFFWADWYRQRFLSNAITVDPLVHFMTSLSDTQVAPHPLFDVEFYKAQLSSRHLLGGTSGRPPNNVADLWTHFLQAGSKAGLSPYPLFDPDFYAAQVDADVAREDLLRHYLEVGYLAGLSPSAQFDEAFYQAANSDVRASRVPGLVHYELFGRAEGRAVSSQSAFDEAMFRPDVAHLLGAGGKGNRGDNAPLTGQRLQRVTMLIPRLSAGFLTGGPNTALALMGLLSVALQSQEVQTRIIALEDRELNEKDLRTHISNLISTEIPRDLEVIPGRAKSKQGATTLGVDIAPSAERFVATTWSTMQMLHSMDLIAIGREPIYLIQDFEPSFYPASSHSVLAAETYSMPHVPVVNTPWLLDYLVEHEIGRFTNEGHRAKATTFWPAIDRQSFSRDAHADEHEKAVSSEKCLVFYARPKTAPRNLFDIGLAALRLAHSSGAFDGDRWRFVAIGDELPPTLVAKGVELESISWVSYAQYAKRIREADVLLALMASPHPSYPPLEGAVSGSQVVTNTWPGKDAVRLREVIPTVHAAEPSVESVALALSHAATAAGQQSRAPAATSLPGNWNEALGKVVAKIKDELNA